jgi:hypothetical protein
MSEDKLTDALRPGDDAAADEDMARVEYTDDAVIVTLLDPLTFKRSKLDEEKTLEALTLPRKIKGKHLKAMDKAPGEMGKTLALIASLANIPASAADDLDGRDVDLILQAMTPFLPKLRGTGPS